MAVFFWIDFLLQNHKYQFNGTGVLLYIAAKLFIFIIKKLMLMLINSIKKRMKEFLKEFAIGLWEDLVTMSMTRLLPAGPRWG